nr:MAG TPA: hypothetical protein [Caudoviricetes sp.]
MFSSRNNYYLHMRIYHARNILLLEYINRGIIQVSNLTNKTELFFAWNILISVI